MQKKNYDSRFCKGPEIEKKILLKYQSSGWASSRIKRDMSKPENV